MKTWAIGMACVAAPTLVSDPPDPELARAELFFQAGHGRAEGAFKADAVLAFMGAAP